MSTQITGLLLSRLLLVPNGSVIRSLKDCLAYETLSETEFNLDPSQTFIPNVFMEISPYLEQKLELLRIYLTEMGEFPFSRSEQNIRALATIRGATAGFTSAEAFMLIRERL